MTQSRVRGMVFDMYGTVVDVGAVAEACKEVAPDPVAFNTQWRSKQLEYTFLRTLMGKYQDFWNVTEEALPRLEEKYPLAILSNGTPKILLTGLERAGQ
ncbi:MAG TPA: HAD-IA family hydrolase [Candidatus Tectomicrobia bacterium]